MKKYGVIKESAKSRPCPKCGAACLETEDRTFKCPKCGSKAE